MKSYIQIVEEELDINFLTQQAKKIATFKHQGQIRKFDGSPYIVHPERVARRAKYFTNDPATIQASFLHDTLEDTKTTHEEIKQVFGTEVADLVQELTSKKSGLDKYGKTDYLIHKMNNMSPKAQLIKSLDRLDNISDFPTAPKKFVDKYLKQTEELLANVKPKNNKVARIFSEIRKKLDLYE